jgi:uncharacterized damage-inducible protein DinB
VTPPDTRVQVHETGDERTMLEAFLDFHRATLRWKCAELTDEQLRRRAIDSSAMSLLGLVRHITDVEVSWFVNDFAGIKVKPLYWNAAGGDTDFAGVDEADVQASFRAYEDGIARVKATVAGRSLDEEFTDERGITYSLRWVYLHMLEEYARHNGHADLLREKIDGATGE